MPLPGRLDGRRLQHTPQGALHCSPLRGVVSSAAWHAAGCADGLQGIEGAPLNPLPLPGVQRPCSWDYRRHGFEPFNEPVDYSQPSGSPSRCSQLCDEDVGGLQEGGGAAAWSTAVGQAALAHKGGMP